MKSRYGSLSRAFPILSFALATSIIACAVSTRGPGSSSGENSSSSGDVGGNGGFGGDGGFGGEGGAVEIPIEESCDIGTNAFCLCEESSGQPSCASEENDQIYNSCVSGEDSGEIVCFSTYVSEDGLDVDCDGAYTNCIK